MARRPSAASTSLSLSPELSRQNGILNTPKHHKAQPTDTTRPPAHRSTSLTQKLGTLATLNNMDPDDLFTKHTISEVKIVQQRLR